MRERFVSVTSELLESNPRTALVLADISAAAFEPARVRHPDRVINVGIREQLMLGVASGLSLTGLRPIAHSYAPFLVERAFEQVKLDLGHQQASAILVSVGASYDWTQGGYTHHSPGDVAVLSTLPGWTIHVPGHPDEMEALLRQAVASDDLVYIRLTQRANSAAHLPDGHQANGRIHLVRPGSKALVVAVGPMLDPVLTAVSDLDVAVAYTTTVRPFDHVGLRQAAPSSDIVLVEPYVAGTSAAEVNLALADRPHRLLSLGTNNRELRRYGTPREHDVAHGLDPAGLRRSIVDFLTSSVS